MIDQALYLETSESLRRFVMVAAVYSAMAGVCAIGIPYAYTMAGSGYARTTDGRIAAIEEIPGEDTRILVTEFVDDSGARHVTRDGAGIAPDARVGDTVGVLYNPDDLRYARPVNSAERWLRGTFIGLAASLLLLALLAIQLGLHQRKRRRWLLRHGRIERGEAPRIEWRKFPIKVNLPPQWRVRASWLEAETVTWHQVVSAWQDSQRWEAGDKGKPVAIYVDPGRPRRSWLPAANLRVPAPKSQA